MPNKTAAKQAFRWSEKSQRYIAPNGRFVARAKVLTELDRVRRGVGQEMRELAKQLQAGEISRVEWLIAMKARVKALHLAHAAVAAGGLDKLTPSDLGRLGAAVRRQYEFLRRWEAEGLPVDGRFIARAELYAGAAYGTFSDYGARQAQGRRLHRGQARVGGCRTLPGLPGVGGQVAAH
jgi:hypothetical protein